MNPVAIVALAAFAACSFGLFMTGRRFSRRYGDLHGQPPRSPWLLQKTSDSELELNRRFALVLLPIDLVALAVYMFQI